MSLLESIYKAEIAFDFNCPASIKMVLSNQVSSKINLGDEEWDFCVLLEADFRTSLLFREEWKLDIFVLAHNGCGDYLMLLPDEKDKKLYREEIFIALHEQGEIRYFANSLEEALVEGPFHYTWSDEFVYRLGNDEVVIFGSYTIPANAGLTDDSGRWYIDEEDRIKCMVEEMIDREQTEKIAEILQLLNQLTQTNDYKGWAFYKLSKIYMKGFVVNIDIDKGLYYNEKAVAAGNKAATAFFYFTGIGVEKDLHKALSYIQKANAGSLKLYTEEERIIQGELGKN